MTTNTYGLTPEQATESDRLWREAMKPRRKAAQRTADRAVARGLLMFLTVGASELVPAMRTW